MSTIIMTAESERACARQPIWPITSWRPHQWIRAPQSVLPGAFLYSNSPDGIQYKGQVWPKDGGWAACLRRHQDTGVFPSIALACAWVEKEVARLIHNGFDFYPGEH